MKNKINSIYKQSNDKCAIACMLMILKHFQKIDAINSDYENKYYEQYKSKYTVGTPFSSIAYHLSLNNLKVELVHSKDSLFTNNKHFSEELFQNLLKEYIDYVELARKQGVTILKGVNIDNNLIKSYLEKGYLIILAGHINNYLHAVIVYDYNDSFKIVDPLMGKETIYSEKKLDSFISTEIGKWMIAIKE